jgi:hypothetical protein
MSNEEKLPVVVAVYAELDLGDLGPGHQCLAQGVVREGRAGEFRSVSVTSVSVAIQLKDGNVTSFDVTKILRASAQTDLEEKLEQEYERVK